MKNFKWIRRAGAFFVACVVFVLFSTGAYLQASEETGIIAQTEKLQETKPIEEKRMQEESMEAENTQAAPAVDDAAGQSTEGQTAADQQDEEGQDAAEQKPENGETESQSENYEKQTERDGKEEEPVQTEGSETETQTSPTETEPITEAVSEAGASTEPKPEAGAEPEDASETAPEEGAQPSAGEGAQASTEIFMTETGADTEANPGDMEQETDNAEPETEKLLDEVFEKAKEQDLNLFGLAPGESITFYTSLDDGSGIMTIAASQVTAVTVTRAASPYNYADYGYGTILTYKFTVSLNDITATAYCIQPSKWAPSSSDGYKVTKMKDARALAKVCYYGTKAAGNEGFFAEKHPDFGEGQRFVITHLAAAYANGSPDAFAGASEKGKQLALELYNYCVAQPDIPSTDMEFSDADVTAYVDPDNPKQQRTKKIKLKADSAQSIVFKLPNGVKLHNVTTDKTSRAGAEVTVTGGTEFYLIAPLTQALDVKDTWSATMKGSLTRDYSAYKISTGEDLQDLVFGNSVEDVCRVEFKVSWITPVNIVIRKSDAETGKMLAGAVFGVYGDQSCTSLLATLPATDENGAASTQLNQMQETVYLKEITAPPGYQLNSKVYTLNLKDAVQAGIDAVCTATDDRVSGKLHLIKKDAQTGTAQGDATLAGAVYGLYARKDIVHPDGKTGVVFQAGAQVTTLTTDAKGEAFVEKLYPGSYYVREISPSNGYLLDTAEHDVVFEGTAGSTGVIEKECISNETVIQQPFQLIKIAGNGKDDADALEGAGFTAYLVSSLRKQEDGSYDLTGAVPVVLGQNGEKEIFTDKDGYACSIPLPFGTYLVRETTVPEGFTAVEDFEVRITENSPNKPQAWRVLIDDEFEAKLKIIKSDDETQQTVLAANTEFKVYDLDAGEYVEQVTTYPKEEKHTSYFTDEEGSLILPQSLPRGHYRIEEVTAPDGYTVGGNMIEVTVDSNTAYRMDDLSQDAIIEVVASNHPVKGQLKVVKKGEVLEGYGEDFLYEQRPLAGAVYEIYAAEDIYTADFQRDADGNRILEYAEGTMVGSVTTDENGEGILGDLPLGKYRVSEKTAPEGYVLSADEQFTEFVYVDQNTPVVYNTVEFVNARQKVEITVVKRNAENEDLLAGAEFGLYAKENIERNGKILVEADTQLATAVTGEDGKAVFEKDLPFGSYYIRELRAPEGFFLSEDVVLLSASYMGQEKETVHLKAMFGNEPTTVEFTKADLTTGTELEGASLSVLDKEGNVIDSWTSEREKAHVIKGLHIGETYILREELAPYGYLRAEEIEFTVSDSKEIQKVKMEDAVPVGRIIISKTGEFVDSVTWNEMVAGTIDSVFGYISGSLQEVVFEVYAAEPIRAADGMSKDHYQKDELVETIKTDSLGYARSGDLPLGRYYVVEKATAEGFVLDDQRREIDLTYRDQDTPVVTYDDKWQNKRQKVLVSVLKKEKDSERVLSGGVFALCAGEDILGKNGNVLIKKDTVIEQKATGEDGRLAFTADLPLGSTYYVKEVKAPAGYATTDEKKEFTFAYAGAELQQVTFDYTFENRPIRVKISKTSITGDKELPGARLQVRDQDGNLVDKWISKKKPHMIEGLVAGETYTLREESAPKGYLIAEEITFKVLDSEKIQTVKMKDDCAQGKVLLKKTDKATGQPLKGVEFTLYDSDGKALETMVTDKDGCAESGLYPIATFKNGSYKEEIKYTLKETKTLNGYRLDDTVHTVQFAWEDDQTAVIEYQLDLQNERIENAPKTGDDTDYLPPAFAMIASIGAAGVLAFAQKRKKRLS